MTVHVPAPVHAPLHPVKLEPDAECAVSVTVAPPVNANEHVAPQLGFAARLEEFHWLRDLVWHQRLDESAYALTILTRRWHRRDQ